MTTVYSGLQPERVWHYFSEINKVPRPSKKEMKIVQYIIRVSEQLGLQYEVDETGNIVVHKPASKGFENLKSVVLQSHVDMVCEKNADVEHDFDKDPIQTYIENGWVKAKGTTLGGDDGIGIAVQLALMESSEIPHGPLEFLFTIDEETGLTGAKGLKTGFVESRILLNLDSEDEGELFIGCAGGMDTAISMSYSKIPVNFDCAAFHISVTGLKGGHSGDDINKGLGNAVKILNRLLWNLSKSFEARLSSFNGGNLRNAIAREAFALVAVPKKYQENLISYIREYNKLMKAEFRTPDPYVNIICKPTGLPAHVIDLSSQDRLLNSLYACPHGVITMSPDIPNFVNTSTNLASIRMTDKTFEIGTSQRSSSEFGKQDVVDMVASVFRLSGGKVTHGDGYPGWSPNPDSLILDITRKAYNTLFNKEPKVLAIHAGLECGIIGENFKGMDMISYGPNIKGAHSPDERLEIESVEKFWKLTLEVLKNIPAMDA